MEKMNFAEVDIQVLLQVAAGDVTSTSTNPPVESPQDDTIVLGKNYRFIGYCDGDEVGNDYDDLRIGDVVEIKEFEKPMKLYVAKMVRNGKTVKLFPQELAPLESFNRDIKELL